MMDGVKKVVVVCLYILLFVQIPYLIVIFQEFMQFPLTLNWGTRDSRTGMIGQPSSSKDGNILEAINLAINVCDKHYMDRELSRVGLSIYILSAGTGVFEVSEDRNVGFT